MVCRCLLVIMACWIIAVMFIFVFFFKQKTAYEMRIIDWSSDGCSSDLHHQHVAGIERADRALELGPLGRRGADLLAVDLGAAGRVELGELLRQILPVG